MTDTKEFISYLSKKHPWMAPVFQEHLEEYNSILPHVFFGELVRKLEKFLLTDNLTEVELSKFIAGMEKYLESGSEAIQELIVVSFLENIEKDSLLYIKAVKFFGTKLMYYYNLRWEE